MKSIRESQKLERYLIFFGKELFKEACLSFRT